MAGDLRLHGHRSLARWSYLLLDQFDKPIRPITTCKGGSLDVSATTRLRSSGSLQIDEPETPIDWMNQRVRIIYDPGVRGVDPWAVATMMFTSPTSTDGDDVVNYTVELQSKMSVIDEDEHPTSFSLPAGTEIIPTVVSLIQSTGEDRITVTESSATLMNPQVWEPGTSKLDIVNDLLEAAGYWALWVDGEGFFRIEPYQNPAERAPSWTFESGEYAIHAPGWQRTQDLTSVPNQFIVVGQGDDENPPLVGVALNEDPESPYSVQSRGRVISRTEEGVEGESQEVFDQLAQRRLFDAMSPVAKLSVDHAVVPLDPNEVVEFVTDRLTRSASVQSMRFDLKFDGQVHAEWREL